MAEQVTILDLDRTLFETDRFFNDVCSYLETSYQVDQAQFRSEQDRFYVYSEHGLRYYDFFSHLGSLGLSSTVTEIESQLVETLRANSYVYPDVEPFLEFLGQQPIETLILTFGEERFQTMKYNCAPVLQDLPFATTKRPKAEYIGQKFEGRSGLIIDDLQVENLPNGFHHVWLQRGAEGSDEYGSFEAISNQWAQAQAA